MRRQSSSGNGNAASAGTCRAKDNRNTTPRTTRNNMGCLWPRGHGGQADQPFSLTRWCPDERRNLPGCNWLCWVGRQPHPCMSVLRTSPVVLKDIWC